MCEWDGETYRWSGTYGHLILFTSACCIITISFIADYYYDAESRWDGVNPFKSLWARELKVCVKTADNGMEVLLRLLTSMEVLPRLSRFGLIVPKDNIKSNF